MFKHSDHPTWRFAPNLGGAEYGNNAGQAHFANDALQKMVREVLQNSLDHPAPGIDTVEVTFETTQVNNKDIQAAHLQEHVGAALQEVTHYQDPQGIAQHQKIMQVLGETTITCLAITDAGTTGLRDDNWTNLIFREGAPTNSPGDSKGGSFGFGKNAPFNLSGANTVIYSTKYIDRAKKGVIQHMAGRSQLVSHNNPNRPSARLQQVGFLAVHEKNQPNQPIQGPQIPEPFRLKETGTGVFIIGFDTRRKDWVNHIAQTTVTQFFYAIHTGRLAVTIRQNGKHQPPHQINQNTLQSEIERLPPKDPTRYYHAAITHNEPAITDPSQFLTPDPAARRIKFWINTDKDAPRRLAHINRRGMFITEARKFSQNPFYPDGGTAWSPWAAVTMANDDPTALFLRRMEPPAHDAVQLGQIQDTEEQESANKQLRHHRQQINDAIRARIGSNLANERENITELADLFPDLGPGNINHRQIKPRVIQHHEEPDLKHQVDDDGSSDTPLNTPNPADPTTPPERNKNNSPNPSSQPTPELPVQNARIIRSAPDELTMSLLMPSTHDQTLTFQIKTAGEQYQRNEEPVHIRHIDPNQDMLVNATLVDGSIRLLAPPNTQVTLHLKLQDENQPYRSYTITRTPQPEATTT